MSVPIIQYPKTMFAVSSLGGEATIRLPNPKTDSGRTTVATMVNAGRNASAVVVAQKIGRDQDKVELAWPYLNKQDWEELLRFFDQNFYFYFTYYNPVAGQKIVRKCYIGDRAFQPFAIDDTGEPVAYVNCTANIIDTGEAD